MALLALSLPKTHPQLGPKLEQQITTPRSPIMHLEPDTEE